MNYTRNREVAVKSFATGGAPPPGKAVKRLRTNYQTMGAPKQSSRQTNQNFPLLISVDDIMTPANNNIRKKVIKTTKERRIGMEGGARPSNENSTTVRLSHSDGHTPTRELTHYYGDTNPPPPTKKETVNLQMKFSNSGRKIPVQGPGQGTYKLG